MTEQPQGDKKGIEGLLSKYEKGKYIITTKKCGNLYIDYLSHKNLVKINSIIKDINKVSKDDYIDVLVSVLTYKVGDKELDDKERGKNKYDLSSDEGLLFAEEFIKHNDGLFQDTKC